MAGIRERFKKTSEKVATATSVALENNVFNIGSIKRNKKDWHTLDIIKIRGKYTDQLEKALELAEIGTTGQQKHSFYIKSLAEGSNDFYKHVIFQDTIRTMADKFTSELLSNVAFKVAKRGEDGEEGELIEIDTLESAIYNQTIELDQIPIKKLCETIDIYSKAILKINVENEKATFEVVAPHSYAKTSNGCVFYSTDENGEVVIEERTIEDATTLIKVRRGKKDPIESETNMHGGAYFEFSFDTFTSVGHELIKEYDLMDSQLPKEVLNNASKVFGDKKLFLSSPINKDFINFVDIPTPQQLGEGGKNVSGSMLSTVQTPFALNDIIATTNKVASNLVVKRGLSKKTLGLDSSAQDFASSLPYENDLTAKTINTARREIEAQLEEFIFILSGKIIEVDLGNYEMVSQEAITANNKEADKFRSLRMKVARELRKDVDDEEVLAEVCRIKIELPMTMDAVEEAFAVKNNLIIPIDVNSEDADIFDDDDMAGVE